MKENNMLKIEKKQIVNIEQKVFKIQALAKVLKLASATSYTSLEVDSEDVQQISEIIEDIANGLSKKILELQ